MVRQHNEQALDHRAEAMPQPPLALRYRASLQNSETTSVDIGAHTPGLSECNRAP